MDIFAPFRNRKTEQARVDKLTRECENLVVERDMLRDSNHTLQLKLDDQLRTAKNDVKETEQRAKLQRTEIEQQHRLADDEVKHLVKIKESKFEIEFEKKTIELEKAKAAEIEKIRNEFRNKLEELLTGQIKDIKEMYAGIVQLLPNVNLKLKV